MKTVRGSCLVPNSVVVAGDDFELVIARRNMRIVCGAASSRLYPLFIISFQLVFEIYPRWKEKTETGIMKIELLRARVEGTFFSRVDNLTGNHHFFHHDRRSEIIQPDMLGIYHGRAAYCGKPEPAVSGLPTCGSRGAVALICRHAVGLPITDIRDALNGSCGKVEQL